MFTEIKKTITWGQRSLVLETGKIARQAAGSALVTYEETSVLATVTFAEHRNPDQSFFPLTVHYTEKYYAAGRIPGGFFKRENRPSEKETLTSRLIDRPLRPLFAPQFRNEVLVMCSVLSHDAENDPDIVAMIAASAALTLSGLPFAGPIAGARVGFENGEYTLNPTLSTLQKMRDEPEQKLDLVVAGTEDAVVMVESEAYELSEAEILGAVRFGHEQMQPVINVIKDLAKEANKPEIPFSLPDHTVLYDKTAELAASDLTEAFTIVDKHKRNQMITDIKTKTSEALLSTADIANDLNNETDEKMWNTGFNDVFKALESSVLRDTILNTGKRIDGRTTDAVRPIQAETSLLPRTHGSALFTRGETQSLVVTTLGTGEDEQIIDALHGNYRSKFLLHYNFPPFSVGEVGRVAAPGRREIGHGKLAWRAVQAVLPLSTEFPYTIRVVSEITESNGSSSMATVCGASLSMMDAGVPLKAPVAGVAMGLVLGDDGRYEVLTDILGDEDHLGDMDFKVAGTENGITSLQMDIKVEGITYQIMEDALAQAKQGRLHILAEMGKVLSQQRAEFSSYAPRIHTITIPTDKIREIIGTGGKVIREIVDISRAKIDVGDNGVIKIASSSEESIRKACDLIDKIVAEPEQDKIYTGKVVKVVDFGAFVNFFGKRDGLVHVSQIKKERVNHPSDVLREGQTVRVKMVGADDRGKIRLSMKDVDQTGTDDNT